MGAEPRVRTPSAGAIAFADPGTGASGPFRPGDRIEWRARFTRPPAAIGIQAITIRLGPGDWEQVVSGGDIWLSHPLVEGYSGWVGPGA